MKYKDSAEAQEQKDVQSDIQEDRQKTGLHNFLRDRQADNALSDHATGLDRFITQGLFLTALLLGAGITLPVLNVSKFFIFTDQISIWSVILDLASHGEYLLFGVVVVFSVLFPVTKILVAYGLLRNLEFDAKRHTRGVSILDVLAKWSIADVLVIALLIVIAKSTGWASAQSELGLYFFTASLALTSFLIYRIKRLVGIAQPTGPEAV